MLRLLTYNVHRCRGTDGLLSPRRIAEVVAQARPDVVAFQEIDVGSARTGGVDQAHLLAHQLGMNVHFQPVRRAREGWSGIAVLTRSPARLARAGLLPAQRLVPRGALWVVVDVNGVGVHVINTHLSLISRERVRQVAALLGPDWLGHIDCREPKILLGDFNAVPRSVAYRAVARTLSDAQRLLEPRRRPKPTFPAPLPTLRLDHVFVSADTVRVTNVDVSRNLLTRVASDHLPLIVDVEASAERAVGPSVTEPVWEPAEPALLASQHAVSKRG